MRRGGVICERAKRQLMRSSAFRMSFVWGEMFSLITEKMNSGLALRVNESR